MHIHTELLERRPCCVLNFTAHSNRRQCTVDSPTDSAVFRSIILLIPTDEVRSRNIASAFASLNAQNSCDTNSPLISTDVSLSEASSWLDSRQAVLRIVSLLFLPGSASTILLLLRNAILRHPF